MGSYLNESDAKENLINIIKQTTTDYKLYIKSRDIKDNTNIKDVVISIIVLPQFSEAIFNALARARLKNCPQIVNITTSLFLDESQRVLKDNILVKVKVNI